MSVRPPSTIAIPSSNLGAKNCLPRKNEYPHLSKDFNWLQLKSNYITLFFADELVVFVVLVVPVVVVVLVVPCSELDLTC